MQNHETSQEICLQSHLGCGVPRYPNSKLLPDGDLFLSVCTSNLPGVRVYHMYSASLGLQLREGEMCPHAPVLRSCAGPQRWHCRPVQTCRNHSVSAGSWWGPTVTPVLKSWRPRDCSMFIGADKGSSGTSGERTHRWGKVRFLCRALTTS